MTGFIFAALFAVVLHAGHPEHTHASTAQHDCSVCQVVTLSVAPSVEISAPRFEALRDVSSEFVVLTINRLSLLPDLRGPPLS